MPLFGKISYPLSFHFYLLLCRPDHGPAQQQPAEGEERRPHGQQHRRRVPGDAARNCPKAARASTAARPAEVVPSQLISGTLPKISTSGTVTEIRMVQNLFSRQYRAEQNCPRAASIQPTAAEKIAPRTRPPIPAPAEGPS